MLETYKHPSWFLVAKGLASRFIHQPRTTLRQVSLEQEAFAGNERAISELYSALEYPTVIEFRKAATAVKSLDTRMAKSSYDFERTRQWFVTIERVGLKTGKGLSAAAVNESSKVIRAMAGLGDSHPRFSSLAQADLYATFLQSTSPDIRQTANNGFGSLGFMQAVTVFGSLTESQDRFIAENRLTPELKQILVQTGQFDVAEFAGRVTALDHIFQRGLRIQYLKDIQTLTGSLPDGYETMDLHRISDLDLEAMQGVDTYDTRRLQLTTELQQTLFSPRGYLRRTVDFALHLYGSFYTDNSEVLAPLAPAMQAGMFADVWEKFSSGQPHLQSV